MDKSKTTKHCCWGECKSDSRYPERMPVGTTFYRFPKPGKISDNMTEWEKEQVKLKTDKAKRWQYLCGRKEFSQLSQIKKDTYICSLHFVGGNSEPILATLTSNEVDRRNARKRKAPTDRSERPPKKNKSRPREFSTQVGHSDPQNQPEQVPEYLELESRSSSNKSTQTVYDQYVLGAKVECMVLRNEAAVKQQENTIYKNNMDPSEIMKDKKKTKHFIGLYPDEFDVLFDFLGPAKYELNYWDSKGKTNDKLDHKKSGPSRRFTAKDELFITLLRLRRGFVIHV